MTLLLLGLALFIGVHFVPSFPKFRDSLISRIGLGGYKGVFSIISLAGFAAIVMGKGQAEFIAVWNPPAMFGVITKLLMLPAMVFVVAAYIPCNIKRKLKHPMLIGVKTWALAHLLSNGDLASIILFGGFLAFAVLAMISANKRMSEDHTAGEEKPLYLDIIALLLGGAIYAGVGMYHMQLFGVPIM